MNSVKPSEGSHFEFEDFPNVVFLSDSDGTRRKNDISLIFQLNSNILLYNIIQRDRTTVI